MTTLHWVGFSGSINTKVNDITEDPTLVSCPLCKKWMELEESRKS